MNIKTLLTKRINSSLLKNNILSNKNIRICQSTKKRDGNYQINGIFALARKEDIKPSKLVEKVLLHLDLKSIAEKVTTEGNNFINIFIDKKFLIQNLENAYDSDRLNISKKKKRIIVVDYSSPNVAKEMHVGHLRSTILGDAFTRIQEFFGHKVIRANHIGDWGTQFGMLIAHLEQKKSSQSQEIKIKDLEKFYKEAKEKFDRNEIFASRARYHVVALQKGEKYCRQLWHKIVSTTMMHNQMIYKKLNTTLTKKDIFGESFYNSMLSSVVKDLTIKNIARKSQGATVVFIKNSNSNNRTDIGVIVQKKDGGYLYTTTDIACLKYRCNKLHADRIVYYIDSRQKQHLKQVEIISKKAGYVPDSVSIEHHTFGMMLDKNRKPLKTRSGNAIKLQELLDEAINRARNLVVEKNPSISKKDLEIVSQVIGIGAVKYGDLSKNRETDYLFNWDNMLNFEGNTAPYIQYAYARILSIFRRFYCISKKQIPWSKNCITIQNSKESQLALCLLQFEEILEAVSISGKPHLLCKYLHDLAVKFSSFYESCPILDEKPSIRNSRLKISKLTARTLKLGLNLLGIETIDRM